MSRHTIRPTASQPCDWLSAGRRYYAYSLFLQHKFGRRVHKISLDAALSCPNVDGTVASGGCVFCDNRSFSPSRRISPRPDIAEQLEEGIARLRRRFDCDRFIAYFQPSTNTYAPAEQLRPLFEQAAAHPCVVGLAVSTRPDCVSDEVLDLLANLAERTHLSVEYGLQSIHNRSLNWMNRGHHYDAFLDAVRRSAGRGFDLCAHVILGIPGETHDDMLATARELARLGIDAVKIHNLYAVRNTPLAEQLGRGEVTLIQRDQFVRTVVDFLELLGPQTRIERIGGGAPREFFIGPKWSLDKAGLRTAIDQELQRRDTWQGKKFDRS